MDADLKNIWGSFALAVMVFVFCFVLYGCTPVVRTEYITTQLTHEPRPILPKVNAAELSCLSKDVYQRLYDRQRLITNYAVLLEKIIESTQPDVVNDKSK